MSRYPSRECAVAKALLIAYPVPNNPTKVAAIPEYNIQGVLETVLNPLELMTDGVSGINPGP
jgi:hypothetical protein